MRIMHISNNYTPYSGGVVSSLNALLPALQNQGHKVMLITLDFEDRAIIDPPWVFRIPSLITGMYKHNKIAIPSSARSIIKHTILSFNPDVIHVHHPFLLGSMGKLLAHRYNIPCVFTYHTMYEQYAHYVPVPQCIVKPIVQKIVFSFCQNLSALIVPSHKIKQYLIDNTISTPLHVIPSPLQEHFFEPVIKKRANSIFNLLYVGRFREEKNIACLIDLFAQLDRSSYCLTLVGYGDQEKALKNKAYKQYNFSEEEVIFVIKPNLPHLRDLYSQADIFLFPSQTDTQGLVLAEAMAHHTPVVAFPGPGQDDIIKQGINGFVVQDIAEMLQCIQKIKHDEILLKKLSDAAYETSLNFKQNIIISSLINVYQTIF